MKIWTVTYNDDHSYPCSSVHLSQAEADAAASEWVRGYAPIPEDQTWQEVYEALREKPLFIDSIMVEVHEVETLIDWIAKLSLPEDECPPLQDVDEYINNLDEERLFGEYMAFMSIIREAREIIQ